MSDSINNRTITETEVTLSHALRHRMDQKGLEPFNSPHEIIGVVMEEYEEAVDEVRANNTARLREELIDLAIACIWGIASLDHMSEIKLKG